MSVIIPQVLTEDKVSGAQIVDGSLRFDSTKSHYLSRTPGSAGNRRTWTWSGWVKRSAVGTKQQIFGVTGTANADYCENYFGTDDKLYLRYGYTSVGEVVTTQVFRDVSSWYHILFAFDATQSTASNKLKLYINGVQVTSFSTDTRSSLTNTDWAINRTGIHYLSTAPNGAGTEGLSALLSNVYFIDGQALGPGYFGYTDPLTNTWRPRKRAKQGSPTVNDGTVWSSLVTPGSSFRSGFPAVDAFNGTLKTSTNDCAGVSGTAGDFIEFDFSSLSGGGVPFSTLEMQCDPNNEGPVYVNGIEVTSQFVAGSLTPRVVTGITSPLTTIKLVKTATNTSSVYLGSVIIDGVIMTDSTTTTVNFGTNGFYLPMDGNSPIGQDRSGRGNNWTPVNFGGSNTIEKATGALPILNTDGGGKVARVGVRTDSNASSLVLALPLVGIKSDFSNAINSGTSNKAITATNAVASNAQSNFYGGSFSFDGTGDILTVPSSSDFQIWSGAFTVECWFYLNSLVDNIGIFGVGNRASTTTRCFLLTRSSGNLQFDWDGWSADGSLSVSAGLSTGRWHHCAVVSNGSTVTIYVNGVALGSASIGSSAQSNAPLSIGALGVSANPSTNDGINGYIQDFRIYKGTAKYTSNFIPASTDPDIVPDSPSGVSYSSNLTQITDGAVAFDGSGDYLTLAYNSDYDFTGEFTLEGFVYPNVSTGDHSVFGNFLANATGNWGLGFDYSTYGVFTVFYYQGNTSVANTGYVPIPRAWNHYAVTRDASNVIRVFLNGQLLPTTATYSGTLGVTSQNSFIGFRGGLSSLNGFLSNVHWVKGTCLYTSDFTPPSAPISSVANTKLLCCKSNSLTGAYDVVPTSGINDGTIWSSLVSAPSGIYSSRPVTNLFNGDTADSENGDLIPAEGDRWTVTYDFGSVSTLRFYTYYPGGSTSNGTNAFEVNGSTVTPLSKTNGGWTSLPIAGGTLTSFGSKNTSLSGLDYCYVAAIEVDGTVLLDPLGVNGNAAATNFNPFTVNINTQRGKQSGYATLNPLDIPSNAVSGGSVTVKNGNLVADNTAGAGTNYSLVSSTIGFTTSNTDTGYYLEVLNPNTLSGNPAATGFSLWYPQGGVYNALYPPGRITYNPNNGFSYNVGGTSFPWGSSFVTGNPTWSAAGSVFSVAVKGSNVWVAVNGIWVNGGNPATNTSPFTTIPAGYSQVFPAALCLEGADLEFNFGQKPFKFPPPPGFQPLTLANTPRPTIVRPDQYVGVTTYSGNSGTQSIITGFKPDFIWLKNRTGTGYNHALYDSVRGATKMLSSSETAQEITYSSVTPQSNGFVISGAESRVNESGLTYVGWAWKAGGNSNTFNIDDVGYDTASAAGLTAGTITPTGASVNTKSGFSIIKYAGNQTAGAKVPHGLSQTPDFTIVKQLTGTEESWRVRHKSIDPTKTLYLNQTVGETSNTEYISGADSTTITLSSGLAGINANADYIVYAWAEIPGFSKFGSYTGNNSTDGPVIITGFRPKFLLLKATNSSVNKDWWILDSERNKYNTTTLGLRPNLSVAEGADDFCDFLSNGFKIRDTPLDINESGKTYIYAAFAEAPSFNLYGGQSNAR